MRDDTRQTLQLFVEKADELKSSGFVRQLEELRQTRVQISWKAQDGVLRVQRWGPHQEAIKALVLTLRFFIQDRDGISLRSLCALCDDPGLSEDWKREFKQTRSEINAYLDKPAVPAVQIDGVAPPMWREVMNVFIYGDMAHANRERRRIFKAWKGEVVFPVFEDVFVNVLVNVLIAIFHIAQASRIELQGKA